MARSKDRKNVKTARGAGRFVGYARVSTPEQSLEMQRDALQKAGVDARDIFGEQVSGVATKRPRYDAAMRRLSSGDTLVVWKLDRIARSLVDLLKKLEHLESRGVAFHSITEGIDTSTPAGRLMMHVIGALAQFERDLVVERTSAGVRAAKARGVRIGAVPKLREKDVPKAIAMKAKGKTRAQIAEHFGVSPQTIYVRCKAYEAENRKR